MAILLSASRHELERLGKDGAEAHVRSFMTRQARFLGL